MNEFPQSDLPDSQIAFTVRYRSSDLIRLKRLEKLTGIDSRQWLKALLKALLEAYDAHGRVEVPLAVTSKREAIAHGFLPASKP